jgi:hypothetical protein
MKLIIEFLATIFGKASALHGKNFSVPHHGKMTKKVFGEWT